MRHPRHPGALFFFKCAPSTLPIHPSNTGPFRNTKQKCTHGVQILKVISGESLENAMQSLIYLYIPSETNQRIQIIK